MAALIHAQAGDLTPRNLHSEAAFRKAFKRIHGLGPGTILRWIRKKRGAD